MNTASAIDISTITRILPHRPPFLFVDCVRKWEPEKTIVAERTLRPDEPHFSGHFPGRPIMPGVLVTEALAQTSGLLLGLSELQSRSAEPDAARMFFLAANSIKYAHPAVPGDILILRANADRHFAGLFRFQVEATAGRNVIATGALTLALMP